MKLRLHLFYIILKHLQWILSSIKIRWFLYLLYDLVHFCWELIAFLCDTLFYIKKNTLVSGFSLFVFIGLLILLILIDLKRFNIRRDLYWADIVRWCRVTYCVRLRVSDINCCYWLFSNAYFWPSLCPWW